MMKSKNRPKRGDLVRLKASDADAPDHRRSSGIVLEFDTYHPDDTSLVIPIVKVLWPTDPGWIDLARIERIEEEPDLKSEERMWRIWGDI
jgi:hypothetical protein